MIGAAIGAALSIGGSIIGGRAASRNASRTRAMIEQEKAKNDAWYARRYNEDVTQRADAQRVLTQLEESIKNRNKSIAGRAAVMGGSNAEVAAEKEANAKAMADATSRIVAMGEARKDDIESRYQQRDQELTGQLVGIQNAKTQASAEATKGVVGVLGNLASAVNWDALFGVGEYKSKK